MLTLTAFKSVPDFARGLVRDLRVRWALEEAGLPYRERLIDAADQKSAAYRALQPFGQVPVLEDDGLVLFESGAILLHVAAKSDNLLPADADARQRAIAWVFAALNSVEPQMQNLATIDLFFPNEEWAKLGRPGAEEWARQRLACIAEWLGEKPYLEGAGFTAGDLMMATVLRILRHTDLVSTDAVLGPYLARCEARPAFQRALAAQLATFDRNAA
ncbi:MAG: glutathione S-transferase family protein [Vitreimonas sp.]